MKSAAICVVLLTALAGCSDGFDAVMRNGNFEPPVPDSRVQPPGFEVAYYPTFKKLASLFKRHHEESEKIYNGHGSWGSGYGNAVSPPVYHPLVRDTARRVLGYIDATIAGGGAVYKQRAREGLEHLLKIQQPDGQFIWWYGDPGKGRVGGSPSLYVTSIPAVALIKGYKLFGDKKYLAAANKACDYIRGVPDANNANYDLFAAWALAANYEVTKKTAYLDRATNFALYAIGNKDGSGYQLRSGGWSDRHNQAIWYHGIILRGLATLLSVMPETAPHRLKIQKATFKALNHLISRYQPNGSILTIAAGNFTWDAFASQSIVIVATRLHWPVADMVHLAAKGAIKYKSTQRRGVRIMAIGSLLRAYKQAERK